MSRSDFTLWPIAFIIKCCSAFSLSWSLFIYRNFTNCCLLLSGKPNIKFFRFYGFLWCKSNWISNCKRFWNLPLNICFINFYFSSSRRSYGTYICPVSRKSLFVNKIFLSQNSLRVLFFNMAWKLIFCLTLNSLYLKSTLIIILCLIWYSKFSL